MMRPKKHLCGLPALFSSERGSALPIVGLAMFALVGAVGTAVDMGRVQSVQTRLSNSLDAAGLAAGADVSTVNVDTEARKYFDANYPTAYLGSTITDFDVDVSADNHVLTLSVQATVPTTFMRIFGKDMVSVSATTEITRAAKGMELVLVIDTTGSMLDTAGGGVSKINAAKTASSTLLDVLYGSNNTIENLWVGLVPFSQAVNIGSSRNSWTLPDTFEWGPTSWGGCVDAREADGRDVTDDPPSVALFEKYYWPDDSNNNWITITTESDWEYICHNRSYCICANYGPCGSTVAGDTTTTIACSGSGSGRDCTKTVTTTVTTYNITSTRGPNKSCPQTLQPMVAEKSTVNAAVNSMTAVGNTHIVLGLSWGWRMLSPRWRGLWGGQMDANNLPLDYNASLMSKVVVLMTDGDNTISNSARGAYWYLSAGHLGTTTQTTAEAELDSRLAEVCDSMVDQGIIIYTVALGTDISASTQNLLRNCASKPEYYFLSPTTDELQTVFRMIGDSLANLRVSQ